MVARAIGDLFLPARCGGCGVAGTPWCPACARLVAGAMPQQAVLRGPGLGTVFVAGRYDGVWRSALLAYKEHGRRDLARSLGAALGPAVRAAANTACGPLVLVAVPASRTARRARGHDHVATLVRVAPDLPAPSPLLRWTRRAADQSHLGAPARWANLAGALAVAGRAPAGAAAVLVDDIVTTGATLHEAARACREAGIDVVGAAAVAAVQVSAARSLGARSGRD